ALYSWYRASWSWRDKALIPEGPPGFFSQGRGFSGNFETGGRAASWALLSLAILRSSASGSSRGGGGGGESNFFSPSFPTSSPTRKPCSLAVSIRSSTKAEKSLELT